MQQLEINNCGDSLSEKHQLPVEDGGSIPTSPLQKTPMVTPITTKEANNMLIKWHYLGSVRGIIHAFGHNEGCLVFTNCRSRLYEQHSNKKVIELARMVGKPGHIWAMSSLMNVVMKQYVWKLKYDLCVTYADPDAGHDGMVYKAAGWIFDGFIQRDGHPLFYIDQKRISPRTLYDKHGTQSVKIIQEIYGSRLTILQKQLKRRFVLRNPLCSTLR